MRRIKASSPTSAVLVRHQRGQGFDSEALALAGARPLVSDLQVRWGSWELTEAMLEALRAASEVFDPDYTVMISGQDYLVRDLAAWEARHAALGIDALLDLIADHPDDYSYSWRFVDLPAMPDTALRILRHAAWRLGTWTRPAAMILPRFATGDRRVLVGLRRRVRVPYGMQVVKASQWSTLSRAAVCRLLARDATDRRVRDYFKTVRISDEAYIPSLLSADAGLNTQPGVTTVKRFAEGKASPLTLDRDLLLDLLATHSEPAFARKFARDDDALRDFADTLSTSRGVTHGTREGRA